MCKLKKFLSVGLSMVFSAGMSKKAFADESDSYWDKYCSERNSKGGYLHEYCARREAKKILLSGEKDYVIMENLGVDGNSKYFCFKFNALDKVLSEFGFDKTEFELHKEMDEVKKKENSEFTVKKVLLKLGLGTLLGSLYEIYLLKKQKKEDEQSQKEQDSKKQKEQDQKKKQQKISKIKEEKGLYSFLGFYISSVILVLKYAYYNLKWDKPYKKWREVFDKNYYKEFNLDFILKFLKEKFIEKRSYLTADCLELTSNEIRDIFSLNYFANLGINYTEEEKAGFEQNLKKLTEDINASKEERENIYIKKNS